MVAKYFAGIDVGGTNTKLGIVDDKGQIVWGTQDRTPFGDLELLINKICSMIKQGCEHYDILAVGIGCTGFADKDSGIITDAVNLGLKEIRFKEILEKRLNLPVRIDNDVQVAMMAEKAYGACRNVQHAIYITLGTGIGGGYILDSRPYRGNKNLGGEIGHMVIHKEGRQCACGMRGCFEQYASVSALVRAVREAYSVNYPDREVNLDGKLVFEAIRNGEPVVLNVYNAWIEDLCIGLFSLMSIFAPEVIVIGGGISNEGSFLEKAINEHLHKLPPYVDYYSDIQVKVGQLGNAAGIIGAALLHQELFE